MKHIKLFENFDEESDEPIKLDITNSNSLDIDGLTLTVWYDREGWDNDDDYENELTWAAQNENDTLTEELVEALYPYGLTIDDSAEHTYDLEDGWIDYQLKKIYHADMANDERGIKGLQDIGYTEEEIEALKAASKYGIS